jgi:type VI secretion system secreted protein VgrG
MAMAYKQDNRLLQIHCKFGDNRLLPQKLEGTESFSQLFEYTLTCFAVTGQTPVEPADVVGEAVTIELKARSGGDGESRYITGMVAQMEMSAGDTDFDVYRLKVVPPMWELTLANRFHIYNDMTPFEIVDFIARFYSLKVQDKTDSFGIIDPGQPPSKQPLPKLEYCTQFNESDAAFICRVLERYGVYFWFEHGLNVCTAIFGNSAAGYSSKQVALTYAPQETDNQAYYQGLVSSFKRTNTMKPGAHAARLSDYRWTDADGHEVPPEESKITVGQNKWLNSSFPPDGAAAFKNIDSSPVDFPKSKLDTVLGYRRASSDLRAELYTGVSNDLTLATGSILKLSDHPVSSFNTTYLITSSTVSITQSPAYRTTDVAEGQPQGIHVTFTAIPSKQIFVPERLTPVPRVSGPQAALVSKVKDSDMEVDALGRVYVRFMWDRKPVTTSKSWVRVSQQWAGLHRGSFFWPRVGDEVLVDFLNGDPDDPVIVGSLYNQANAMSYKLPDNQTRSGWISRSVPGGTDSTASSFYFEDKKGHEEVHLHAERNLNINVEAGSTRMVGGDETIAVWGDQFTHHKKKVVRTVQDSLSEKVFNDVDRRIMGSHRERVDGPSAIMLGGEVDVSSGSSYNLSSKDELNLSAASTVRIASNSTIELNSNGNIIQLGPQGITIVGTMVKINSGGSPLSTLERQTIPPTVVDPPDWMKPDPSKLEANNP